MASPLTLTVQPRGRPIARLPKEITVTSSSGSTDALYDAITSKTGYSVHRLRITKGSDGTFVPSSRSTTIHSTGLRNNSTIAVKDLGPQIPWRVVFLIEYLGPLLIHPLFYYGRPYIYKNPSSVGSFPAPSERQTLGLVLLGLHFLKRELETLFVHRFSNATMPASKIFLNSAHYWLLAGLNVAYWIYSPIAPIAIEKTSWVQDPIVLTGLALFSIGQLGNLHTHLVLRNLRPAGSTARAIPRGGAFELVTCPNYMFEIIAWVGMTLVTFSWSTALFTVVAAVPMGLWGIKKEKRYRKEFGDKYHKKQFVMIPGLI